MTLVGQVVQDNIKFILYDDNTAKIVSSPNVTGDVLIPLLVRNRFWVTEIQSGAFANTKIKSLRFPKNSYVSSLSHKMFFHSTIEHLLIPSTIRHYEDGWCFGAFNLNRVEIIGENNQSFHSKDGLTFSVIQNRAVHLLFCERSRYTVVIPNFVKKICSMALSFNRLTNITFDDSSMLTKIGNSAFRESSIEKIVIPSSVVEIEDYAFYGCKNLTAVSFGEGDYLNNNPKPASSLLQFLGKEVFSNTAINYLNIVSEIKSIQSGCFRSCQNLTKVIFRVPTLVKLEQNVFEDVHPDFYIENVPGVEFQGAGADDNFELIRDIVTTKHKFIRLINKLSES
ncbi:hypothetical protein TRFO_37140 [Tritrichomonas foetus]|uniref:Surface antigen BspA-like n=1 Tax=Tritrichomonas foetus TaxID=1144522 RepID=A0A1J4JH98_9EUKA|nr:hypothetical protein TRFO_37140 [Tritrichomonas foetus]|eukprot:OHS96644.1 hypothetical protein TRFO_37140 [Tritrichomonas foetus]